MLISKRTSNEDSGDKNKWLKRLQQESWELELLVSGFSILLLFKASHFLVDYTQSVGLYMNSTIQSFALVSIFLNVFIFALWALIANLSIHLLMRGFWVGIVGLGSVAPHTDIEKLNYSPFFTKKLKSRVGNLDNLVVFLDNISSLVFAFAFLIVFLLLALALFFGFLLLYITLSNLIVDSLPGILGDIFGYFTITLIITIVVTGIIYFIDFISLGLIKKSKRLAKIYYPFYVFYGWITLAFLYRVIYYNLMSRFSKKRIAIVLLCYLIGLTTIPSLYMDHSIYFETSNQEFALTNNAYYDQRPDDEIIKKASIPSKIISNNFLPLFIRYEPTHNNALRKRFKDFTPTKEEKLKSTFAFKVGLDEVNIGYTDRPVEKEPGKALECLVQFYKVYLNDSLVVPESYYFATNPNKDERGIEIMLDIEKLKRGKHNIDIKLEYLKNDSLVEIPYFEFPFWKE